MKIIKKFNILILTIAFLALISCSLEGGESLNGASTSSISDDLSRGELPQAVSGVISEMRTRINTQVDVQSILGREYYYITNSDPRYEGDVVTGNLDDNTFYVTQAWGSRYAAIKEANLALAGLENTTSDFSPEEIAASRGVLNTLKAHELLMVANNQESIRINVADPDNLGPFVGHDAALAAISELLVSAAADLTAGGTSFPFSLTSGYAGFDTPAGFLKFNKALTARVEAYRGNYTSVLSLLGASFMNMTGDLKTGVYHTFSLSGADIANPLFLALNQEANVRMVQSSFITDALPNDTRVNKAVLRNSPKTASGLVGNYDVYIYQSNVASVPVIRNEELILLFAEANMVSNPLVAVDAINVVRNAAGLGNYSGAQTAAALESEILFQRRYSLFGESHRWIDMRRFGRLNELPNDRAGDAVPAYIPIPRNENQ
ncbi:RagB/SusD family nutrient uptake outer membrane protein [Mariniflexile sp. AS56]|uniref:RagB/SusD family nutrient uptake outer membrane protein n=1 Tax=Mariniflexile sp. AS56 TaxID=3063957 RepID=UPI0026E9D164|nr:RagB/SusD family nutrient uptake outer membrane protein [Mariniflexile sp. AS56]MDO7173368.1 RagB/SusD family nutrient uptake outer membrane protein [Mariniflexile sp. AS56]